MPLLRELVSSSLVGILVATLGAAAPATELSDDFGDVNAEVDDNGGSYNVWANWVGQLPGLPPRPRPAGQPQREARYSNALICYSSSGQPQMAPQDGWCESGIPVTARQDCEQLFVAPTWRQWVYPDGSTSEWVPLDRGSCSPALPVLTVEDFRSLPLPAPVLRLQPDGDWVLVNVETIVMTDDSPVALRTTLAGFGVDVEARPVRFEYDFGDGHTLVTRSPGRPHPDHDTFHVYEEPGQYAITLTTQWAGRYRVDGDPTWREVTGTATTSRTSAPFEAQERRARLVPDLCTDRPTPPDC